MSDAADLYRLQQADSAIASLRGRLAETQARLQADPELERRRATALSAGDARNTAEAAAAGAEAELKNLEDRVRALDRRLYGGSVHNPQELLDMQHDLEALRARLTSVEARAIQLLDDAERAAQEERSASVAVQEQERRRTAEIGPLSAEVSSLEAALQTAVADREAIAAGVGARDRALYERVAARHQPAVVGLQGDACGGCHLPLSNEERRLVRAGGAIVQCSNCDRILVP